MASHISIEMDFGEIPEDDYNAIIHQIFQENPAAIVTTAENIIIAGPETKISELFESLDMKDSSTNNADDKHQESQQSGATATQAGEDFPSPKTPNEDEKEQNRKRIDQRRAKQPVNTGPSQFPFKFLQKMVKGEVDLMDDVDLPDFLLSNEEKKESS